MNIWLGLLLVTCILLTASLLWIVARYRQAHSALADAELEKKRVLHQVQQLESTRKQLEDECRQAVQRRRKTLGSIDTLFDHVGGLDRLLSQQINSVSQALNKVGAESQVSQNSGEQALQKVQFGSGEILGLKGALDKFSQMGEALKDLNRLIQSVADHSSSIGRIADESRLLSLNASIEAARAGSHGRGFAVVAQSVTDLAEKSAESANQIQSISTDGEAHVTQLLSESTEVIEQTQKMLNQFSDVYQQVEQSMMTAFDASLSLQEELTQFQSSYETMCNASKTTFESLTNELTTIVGQCNNNEIVDISVQQARTALDSYDYLIDVRRGDEYNDNLGHIQGTVNINVQAEDFEQQLAQLDKSKDYLWICRSGGRSKRAALLALRKGFTGKCHNMVGGMLAWNDSRFPTR